MNIKETKKLIIQAGHRAVEELINVAKEKITDEQLRKLQDTVNGINRAQLEIGSMEIRKHEMMHNIADLRDKIAFAIFFNTILIMPTPKYIMV